MLGLEKTLLHDRVVDLKERLSELKTSHEIERLRLQAQLGDAQNKVNDLTRDLSLYSRHTPDLVAQALHIVGNVVTRPSDGSELIRSISLLQAGQNQPVVELLEILKQRLKQDDERGIADSKKLGEILRKIGDLQPGVLKRLGEIAGNTSIGVAGNALWSAIQILF